MASTKRTASTDKPSVILTAKVSEGEKRALDAILAHRNREAAKLGYGVLTLSSIIRQLIVQATEKAVNEAYESFMKGGDAEVFKALLDADSHIFSEKLMNATPDQIVEFARRLEAKGFVATKKVLTKR